MARNYFGKDFFKLMNNSVFGKTMETIIDDLAVIRKSKERLTLNRPAFVGTVCVY